MAQWAATDSRDAWDGVGRTMDVFVTRTFLFVVLPVLLGVGIILFDPSARGGLRRSEALLVPLFVVGVAGSGIGGFIAHFFLSDEIAESIGWPTGSPFQLEVAFANLAMGILGAIAADRRDGFREATVLAVTVFSVGATIVHLLDIQETGNLSPGNTIQNVSNLLRPALLIALLIASRRSERGPEEPPDLDAFDRWRAPLVHASVVAVVLVSSAFAVGFATGQTVAVSALGAAVACAAFAVILVRDRSNA